MRGLPGLGLIVAFLAAAAAYVPLALFPAEIGRWLAARLRGRREPGSFWDLADIVRSRRVIVRWMLTGLILASGVATAGLLALARDLYRPRLPDWGLVLAVLAMVGLVAALARVRASGLGRPAFTAVDDADLVGRARRALEGVAVAAGIRRPPVQVAGHPRAAALTILVRSEPVVVFTTGLVTLLSGPELEAVAAHEAGHIATNAIDESQTIESLLDAFRLLGTAALWLFLFTRPSLLSAFVIGLTVLVAIVAVRILMDPLGEEVRYIPSRVLDAVILLLNPPMVLANVAAQALYQVMGQDEDLLADLRAVEYTRNPEALHAALRRIRETRIEAPAMPLSYHYRYFTAEGTLPDDFPAAQAPIAARLAMLERIAPSLRVVAPLRERPTLCPDCGRPLSPLTVSSHYGAPIPVDECGGCGGIWFDDLELYMAGARDLVAVRPGQAARPLDGRTLDCPRCQVSLARASTWGMPADVCIWECGICRGAWVRPADLVRFGRLRDQRRARRSAAARAV